MDCELCGCHRRTEWPRGICHPCAQSEVKRLTTALAASQAQCEQLAEALGEIANGGANGCGCDDCCEHIAQAALKAYRDNGNTK